MNIETNKIAGAVFGSLLFVVGVNVIAGGLFAPHKPAVPGYDLPAPEETAGGRRPGGRARRTPADPSREGRSGQGPVRRQEVPGLPQLREGRAQQGRSRPLRRRRTARGLARGLQLFRRPQGQGRQLDLRGHRQVHPQPEGLPCRARSWPSRASRSRRSGPTSWPTCGACPRAPSPSRPPSRRPSALAILKPGHRARLFVSARLPCSRPVPDRNVGDQPSGPRCAGPARRSEPSCNR